MKFKNYIMLIVKFGLGFGLGLGLIFCISGCSEKLVFAKPETTPPPVGTPEKTKKTTAIYHDFEDVLIPKELKIIKERTVVLSSPGFRSGLLALKGMVDSTSLFDFFSNNMQKDNWNVVSKIKSPNTTIMVFQKSTRSAVITIKDSQIYTYVEIGVAPRISERINDGGSGMELSE